MTGLLLLFLLSFLLLGPKKTSELARMLGEQVGSLKRTASELQAQLERGMPDGTLSANSVNPVGSLRQTIADLLTEGVTIPEDELKELKSPAPAAQIAQDSSMGTPQRMSDRGIGEPE